MKLFSDRRSLSLHGTISERAAEVMRLFGLDRRDLEHRMAECACQLEIGPGQICLITGPSGTGKTLLLKALYECVPRRQRLWLNRISLHRNVRLIDCIEGPVWKALRILCRAGLSDVFTMLNSPQRLSEGQKYRYRLVQALLSGRRCLFADEFGCSLDPLGARILAFQVGRIIRESGTIFLAATCHEDLAISLEPDVLIRIDSAGRMEISRPQKTRQRIC